MPCNCKKKREIEDKYGVPQDENIFYKCYKIAFKIMIFLIFVLAFLLLLPLIFIVAIYKLVFSKNTTIVLPKIMGKYLE